MPSLCTAQGLPPRARGSPDAGFARGSAEGPTPACAGITARSCRCASPSTAYPRVRGDHRANIRRDRGDLGLPPRARGSRRLSTTRMPTCRPTPACAGITRSGRPVWGPTEAYPRVRGDHSQSALSLFAGAGLPPRARGSRRVWRRRAPARGPTPACAGITQYLGDGESERGAYPRVRGDHVSAAQNDPP